MHERLFVAKVVVFLSIAGCSASSGGAVPPIPIPPQLSFQLPSEQATLISPTLLSVSGDEVTLVRFEMDAIEEATLEDAPYAWMLDPQQYPAGSHRITVSVEWAGGTDQRSVNVTIAVPPAGAIHPPEVYEAVANLAPGTWYEIPNTHLAAVAPDPVPAGSVDAVIGSWCGGAYDTKRDRLYAWGGGHGNYAGNEVYGFDLIDLRWLRLTDPSPIPASGVLNDDGTPMTRHTYDYLAYLPTVDAMAVVGGAAFWELRNYNAPADDVDTLWLFHPSNNTWTTAGTSQASGVHTTATVDADGVLWAVEGNTSYAYLWSYDPTTEEWTSHTHLQLFNGVTSEIDPVRGVLVYVGSGTARRFWLDDRSLLDPADPWKEQSEAVSLTGAGPVGSVQAPGLAYHPTSGKLVAWGGGRTVYSLDTEDWTWSSHPGAGPDPGSPTPNGTFSRWAWSARQNVFVLVTGSSRNVFVYRPSVP